MEALLQALALGDSVAAEAEGQPEKEGLAEAQLEVEALALGEREELPVAQALPGEAAALVDAEAQAVLLLLVRGVADALTQPEAVGVPPPRRCRDRLGDGLLEASPE